MKKKYVLLPLLMMIFSLNAQHSIMTYNIRYNNPNDKENWWENRKEDVAKLISHYKPDILGIQEGLHDQVTYLDDTLTNYSYVGVGRDDGKQKGEYAAIFFNPDSLEILDTKTYWLSDTPHMVSVGWDASMERIVTYAMFKDKNTKKTIHVFNCHYDHIGKEARKNSSKLVLGLINDMEIQDEPIAVIGDLNSHPDDEPIQILKAELDDAFEISKIPAHGPIGTFNGFNPDKKPTARIDYILTKNIPVISYDAIDDRRENNLYPSDHLPIFSLLY
ncbi:endonuclease/exonuclease/phosphatase family protein [Flagellimonas onchidii]|uniref:endonuclease/exonuclease/phosphatase family protein n=1 Tax=Flagellimonas onchidii TaxID=2562684 RepID=UPI001F101325|nr:endonuclease/exonuclease/phosphatase family protein [Allomuricauda onchidii]